MSSENSAGEQRADNAQGHKSTPLRPTIIMTTALVWALVVALIVRAPAWASVFLAALTGASFLAFLVGYIYLFVRDRESLRSGRGHRAALVAKPDMGARGAVEAGGPALLGIEEPAVVCVPEAERVVERRSY